MRAALSAILALLWLSAVAHAQTVNPPIIPGGAVGAYSQIIPLTAKCDGVTDDTTAIQAWALKFGTGKTLTAPPGKCIFKDTIQFGSAANGGDLGATVNGSGLGTIFLYAGASTTKNLLVFGYPSTGTAFGTEVNQSTIGNFKVSSNTPMTAGAGIVLWKFGRGSLINVYADAQDTSGSAHNLFNGFLCAGCNDITIINSAAEVKNDNIISYSMTPTGNIADGCYCGVVYISGGKYSGATSGIHLTGLASVTFDNGEVIGNQYNVVLDTVNASACNCVAMPGNQGFFLGPNGFVDSAVIENFRIDDSGLSGGNKIVQLFGNVATSGTGAGIDIVHWNNNGGPAQIDIATGQIAGAKTDGILVQDGATVLAVAAGTQIIYNGIGGAGYGINCSVVNNNIHVIGQLYGNPSGNLSASCHNVIKSIGQLQAGAGAGGTFNGVLSAIDSGPDVALYDTSQGADLHYWDMYSVGGVVSFRALNDAYSSSLTALSLDRSGNITAPHLPASAGAGGKFICADNTGKFYLKATCP